MVSVNIDGSVLGTLLTLFSIVFAALIGSQQGFRRTIGPAIATTVAYLLLVREGDLIVNLVNRLWSNAPRFGAFLIGRDPNSVPALDPLISGAATTPLAFRILLFAGVFALGLGYAWPWRGKDKPKPNMQTARGLGALLGAYVAALLLTSIGIFARTLVPGTTDPYLQALTSLPDWSAIIPSMIAVFGIVLLLIIILRLPQIWKT